MANTSNKNVFINCPFDNEYLPLLQPMIFTLIALGFTPRISKERLDSGETRFSKICQLISESAFGIHDLSRIRAAKKGEYSRFNMPFELGLDIGAKVFNQRKFSSKKHLILEKEKYRYQRALSDLSNSDIKSHSNKEVTLVKHIRNWLVENGLRNAPSPTRIWYLFIDFISDFDERRRIEGFTKEDIYEMPINEFINYIKEWIDDKSF